MAEIGALAADADALFGVWIGPDLINADFLARHPRLRYIATLGHGWEPFDTGLARAHGLTVTNTVYGAQTIAEYAFALLMEVCHHIFGAKTRGCASLTGRTPPTPANSARPLCRSWNCTARRSGWSVWAKSALPLPGWLPASGCGCWASAPTAKQDPRYDFITQVESLDELLALSDIVSLHLPHTPETEHILNAAAFAKNEGWRDPDQHRARRAC